MENGDKVKIHKCDEGAIALNDNSNKVLNRVLDYKQKSAYVHVHGDRTATSVIYVPVTYRISIPRSTWLRTQET